MIWRLLPTTIWSRFELNRPSLVLFHLPRNVLQFNNMVIILYNVYLFIFGVGVGGGLFTFCTKCELNCVTYRTVIFALPFHTPSNIAFHWPKSSWCRGPKNGEWKKWSVKSQGFWSSGTCESLFQFNNKKQCRVSPVRQYLPPRCIRLVKHIFYLFILQPSRSLLSP